MKPCVLHALSFSMENIVCKPTRVDRSATSIDHVWTSDPQTVKIIDTFIGVGDHFGIALSINFCPDKQEEETITYRDMKSFNATAFSLGLAQVPWDSCFIFDDINDQYSHFQTLLTEVINEHAPMKTIKAKPRKEKLPFLTKELKAMIKSKNLLHKQSRQDRTLLPIYKDMRRTVKRAIQEAEKQFYDEALEKTKSNPKKMWQVLNNTCGFRKPKLQSRAVQNQKDANTFNDFFTKVPDDVQKELDDTMDRFRIQDRWEDPRPQAPAFDMRESTTTDMETILSNLDTSKAIGHDSISAVFLRAGIHELSPIFSRLMNICLLQGKFPSDQKVARVIPVHKKGDIKEPGNYRPVSILTSASKVFERFLADRIIEHIEYNELLNVHQSGFRRKHGTHTALHHMLDKWATALGNGKAVAVLAIDLSKAFDCLNQKSIRAAFSRLGMEGCDIIFDYLSNRKQFVHSNSFKSSFQDITTGVPQGSILGPLLFILALSDIEAIIDEFIHMFADDITTWMIGTSWREMSTTLERTLKNLFAYLAFKGLKINMSKCHLMVLGRQNLKDAGKARLQIQLFDTTIEDEPELTLLGIKIDKNLDFDNQVQATAKKCNDNIRFLWRTAKNRNLQQRTLLANAIVNSYLSYCDTLLHIFINEKLRRLLDGVHHRMLGFIYQVGRGQRISYETLCAKHKTLSLGSLREVKLQTLIYKIVNHPDDIPSYLVKCIARSDNNTRNNSQGSKTRNEIGRKTLNNIYCNQYLSLPIAIRGCSRATIFFSKMIKDLF